LTSCGFSLKAVDADRVVVARTAAAKIPEQLPKRPIFDVDNGRAHLAYWLTRANRLGGN
jgi:hypothetical protein